MSKTTKRIIIMGQSDIADKFVPTAHGTFGSIRDAEVFGNGHFKTVNWRVANEITREDNAGNKEVSYDFLTDIKKPRLKLAEA